MKKAAVGFSVHSGWCVLVAVSLEKSAPTLLTRQRVQLVETFSYKFRQPYHTAEKMPFEKAAGFIAEVQAEAENLAHRSLRAVQLDLEKKRYRVDRGALLLASGRPLPELPMILRSHALIHTADGELFRNAISKACERLNISVTAIRECELNQRATTAFGNASITVQRIISTLRSSIGPPWTKDHKSATLAAALILCTSKSPATG
jgi:hypothetical protein